MMRLIFIATLMSIGSMTFAQTTSTAEMLYKEIPSAPKTYTSTNVAARMIDGLGYRYYWATIGLRAEDLAFRPSPDARSAQETLDHLYGLSQTILNAVLMQPNIRPAAQEKMSFEVQRQRTLENLYQASTILKASKSKALKKFKIIFKRGESQSEFPFWNMLNGPIADAIYHTGQIVSFRRASGNPMDPGVNVFMGKTKE